MNIISKQIKNLINRFGYDIKYYRPFYETVIRPLGIRTILDIGANTGEYTKEMRQRFPNAKIYAFEPLKDCFEKMKQKMAGDKNFKDWNMGLGDTNAELEIERSFFHPSSSFRKMSFLHKKLYPKSAQTTPERVFIRRLDDIILDSELEKPILIKIDVQGFEDKVILGGKKIIKKAAVIIIETSFVTLYEGQPLFDDIYKMLTELNFSYYGDAGRHYNQFSGKLIYEDSVFLKKNLIIP